MRSRTLTICLAALAVAAPVLGQDDVPLLTGPYLGQEPPGPVPVHFAPGIVSVDENFEHSAAVFSPDGERLYIEYGERSDDADIFVAERTGDGWSRPRPLPPTINTPAIERLHCVTADGSLYFSRSIMTPREQVLVARLVDGEFAEPEVLGEDYDSPDAEIAILIEPRERYMLVCGLDAQRRSHLSISYRWPDGSWSARIPAPYYSGGFLALSPDGKYLFLENEGILWVSTDFVERLRPPETD